MTSRFELLDLGLGAYRVKFLDASDRVLVRNMTTIDSLDEARATIDWLRVALARDWLYRIERTRPGAGPRFRLRAPGDVICASPPFSSSDAMERAIEQLRSTCARAPLVAGRRARSRGADAGAPALAPLRRGIRNQARRRAGAW